MKIIISVREYDIKTPQYDRIDQVLNGKDYSLAPPRVPAPLVAFVAVSIKG